MKILYIIESLGSGGKERRLIELIKGFSRYENNDIEIIILSKTVHYQEIYDLVTNIHFLKRDLRKDISLIHKFIKVLRNFKPEIIHCWDNIAAMHFAPISRLKGIPFINSMISTAPSRLSIFSKLYWQYAISYPFSNILLTNSKAGLWSFRVPAKKGRFIHNGFDMNRNLTLVDKNEIRKKFNIETKHVVGMTASFSVKKDYETFVGAAQEFLKKERNITFVAIGDGPKLKEIKALIEPGNEENFRFLGRQRDVESIANIFDIGVLTTFTEGISNALMEFMSLSKPVIATDGGGTNELVLEKETGYLIDQGNQSQLVHKFDLLLSNPGLALMMGSKGKKRIEENFSMDCMVQDTYKLYKELLR